MKKLFILFLFICSSLFAQNEIIRRIEFNDSLSSHRLTLHEVDSLLNLRGDITDSYSNTETDSLLNLKRNVSDSYSDTQIDSLLLLFYTKVQADSIKNLYYTKVQSDSIKGLYYPSSIVDSLLNLKLDATVINDYYDSSQVDSLLGLYFTKLQIDSIKSLYYTKLESDSISALYYLSSIVDSLLNLKLNASIINNYSPTDSVYTKSQLNAGQLDTRYYTESEVNTIAGAKLDTTKATEAMRQAWTNKQDALGYTPLDKADSTDATSYTTKKQFNDGIGAKLDTTKATEAMRTGWSLAKTRTDLMVQDTTLWNTVSNKLDKSDSTDATSYTTKKQFNDGQSLKADTLYLSGITSNVQQQINGKQNSLGFVPAMDDSTYTIGEITNLLAPKFNTTDFASYFNTNFTAKGLRQGAYLSDTTKFFLSTNFNSSFDSRFDTKTLDSIGAGTTNVHLTTTLKSNYDDAYAHAWRVTGNSVASKDTLPYQIHSFTTTERDSWTPANGWLFRNSTLSSYQVYENGWQTLASGEWTEANYISKTDTTDYLRYTTSTAGYVPYFSAAGVLSNSGLYFDGTNYGFGTTNPGEKLEVAGAIRSTNTSGFSNVGATQANLFLENSAGGVGTKVFQLLNTGNKVYLRGLSDDYGSVTSPIMTADLTNGNVGINKTTNINSKLAVVGLPTYADNAAAVTGGLTVGDFYKTSTGQLMVVYE